MAILKRGILVLGLIGVGVLVAAELVLRFFYPQPERAPVTVHLRNDFSGADREVEYSLNEQSLRTVDWDVAGKPDGAKRILFVGGTSTDAIVHNAGDTWWGKVWESIQEMTPFEVEAAAYSTGGEMILETARWCDENLEELDVDLLVVNFGLGDALNKGTMYRYDPDRFYKIRIDPRSSWKKSATEWSHLYRFLRNQRDRSRNAQRQRLLGRENYLAEVFERRRVAFGRLPRVEGIERAVQNDPLLEYLDGIDKMIELSRRTGTKLLILGEPVLHHTLLGPDEVMTLRMPVLTGPSATSDLARPDPGWVDAEVDRFYEAGRARCTEEGVMFYSLNGRIAKLKRNFMDDAILTLEGNEAVAEKVVPLVNALLTGAPAIEPAPAPAAVQGP